MKINRRINLVLTLEDDDGRPKAYVHHTPIDRAIFEAYFLSISRAYAAMAENGGEWMLRMGPRTAFLMLRRAAEIDNSWEGPNGVSNGLVNEIRRLTNVLLPGVNGWETVAYQDVLNKPILDEEELADIDNAITFFTVASSSMKIKDANEFLEATFGLYGAQVTPLLPTELINSLPTSTQGESTGEKEIQSSIPH